LISVLSEGVRIGMECIVGKNEEKERITLENNERKGKIGSST